MAGDFTAVRAFNYSSGAIIFAARHNTNENAIYTAHNNSMNATTGHQHTGAVGDGAKLTSAGLALSGSFAWTGAHSWSSTASFTGDVTMSSTVTMSLTQSFTGTATFDEDALYIFNPAHTFKYGIRGGVLVGNSNLSLPVSGATDTFVVAALAQTLSNKTFDTDTTILTTKKFNFNVGGTVYAYELSANSFAIATASVDRLLINANGIGVPATSKIFLEGTDQVTKTYISAPSGNAIGLYTVDTLRFQITSNGFGVPATSKQWYDGVAMSGDTYRYESAANTLDDFVGGVNVLRMTATGATFTGTLSCGAGAFTCGAINASGTLACGTATVTGDVNPEADGTRNLGTHATRWNSLVLNSTVSWGSSASVNSQSSIVGSSSAITLTMGTGATTHAVQFTSASGVYVAGAPGITGYFPIVLDGVTYKVSVST